MSICLTVTWKNFHDKSHDIFRVVLCEKWVSIMFKRGFLEMEIEVLGGTVSLLTGGILFPSAAVGSRDSIGMWSLKISLLAHERPKKLV